MNTSKTVPCKKDHVSERRANGNCIQCEKERYNSNPKRKEYVKAKQAARRAKIKADPEKLQAQRNYMKDYSKRNRSKLSAQSQELYQRNKIRIRLQRKKIPRETHIIEYIENHDGLCDLCGKSGDGRWKELSYDHCHTSGQFRGLLCSSCNRALGYFQDSPELLERAAEYLRHYI